MDMLGKVVLISGGGKGIGKVLAISLLEAGYRVAVFSRGANLSDFVGSFPQNNLLVMTGDVRDEASVRGIVESVRQKFGSIDVLVNNAGYGYFSVADQVDIAKFTHMLETNIVGVANCVKYVLPEMKEKKSGLIINIASVAGKVASKEGEFYNATKFGLLGYTKGLRIEVKPHGVRVASVNPGMVKTDFFTEESLKERCRMLGFPFPPPMLDARDVAGMIRYIIEQPNSVEIQDVDIMPF